MLDPTARKTGPSRSITRLLLPQIDARGVERAVELLDPHVAVDAFEHRPRLLSLDQRVPRQRVVVDRVAPDPLLIAAGVDRVAVVSAREQAADEGAHAHASHPVDDDAGALQHLEHADVGERPRSAAAQHDADRSPGQPPRDARHVARVDGRRP